MILTVSALLGESKSNSWALQFSYSILIDQIISQPVGIIIKVLVLKMISEKYTFLAKILKKTYLSGIIKSIQAIASLQK